MILGGAESGIRGRDGSESEDSDDDDEDDQQVETFEEESVGLLLFMNILRLDVKCYQVHLCSARLMNKNFSIQFLYQAVCSQGTPRRDPNNCRLYEHEICIRHCQDSMQPVPSQVHTNSARAQ